MSEPIRPQEEKEIDARGKFLPRPIDGTQFEAISLFLFRECSMSFPAIQDRYANPCMGTQSPTRTDRGLPKNRAITRFVIRKEH